MSTRFIFTKKGVPGEECYIHADRQSHRYRDTQHAYDTDTNPVLVNICPECAGDKSRKVEPATVVARQD